MNWTEIFLGTGETSLKVQVSGSFLLSFLLGVGYLAGAFGSSSFASWGLPRVPVAAAFAAILVSAGIAYVRGGLLVALPSACLAFLGAAIELVVFEWVGFTLSERLGFLLDFGFLILSLGCLFGCIGYASGVVLRRGH